MDGVFFFQVKEYFHRNFPKLNISNFTNPGAGAGKCWLYRPRDLNSSPSSHIKTQVCSYTCNPNAGKRERRGFLGRQSKKICGASWLVSIIYGQVPGPIERPYLKKNKVRAECNAAYI